MLPRAAAQSNQSSGNASKPMRAHFSQQFYPQKTRAKEAMYKKIFGVLNGVGWAATFVGGLTLTGIGTLGLGTKAIITLSAATLPTGTAFGLFHSLDEIAEQQKQEKELIEDINQRLVQAQEKQILLFKDILYANDLLLSRVKKLAALFSVTQNQDLNQILEELANKDMSRAQEIEFQHLIILTKQLVDALDSLKPINLEHKIRFNGCESTCAELNADIATTKSELSNLRNPLVSNQTCKTIIERKERAEVANRPILFVDASPIVPAHTEKSTLWDGLKSVGKKIFTAGYGAGIGFGIGTIFCGIALASSPPGWAILATLAGIAVASLVVGVITYKVEQSARLRHKNNMQRLADIKTDISDYYANELKLHAELEKACTQVKTPPAPANIHVLVATPTPVPTPTPTAAQRRSCKAYFDVRVGASETMPAAVRKLGVGY